eukprot:c48027_g1_i1 orf=184-345(+)
MSKGTPIHDQEKPSQRNSHQTVPANMHLPIPFKNCLPDPSQEQSLAFEKEAFV